jgi:regulatory protein
VYGEDEFGGGRAAGEVGGVRGGDGGGGEPRVSGGWGGEDEPRNAWAGGRGRRNQRSAPRPRVEMDPETAAREICLRQLAVRARSRAELAAALAKRGVEEDVAERVLSRFGEVGLIDDRAFAEEFVASRHGAQGLARRALSLQLQQRGVDSETAAAALEAVDDAAEEAAARELVVRRLRGTAGLEPAARVRKVVGVLARKGYSPELAYRVTWEELRSEGVELEDEPPVDL